MRIVTEHRRPCWAEFGATVCTGKWSEGVRCWGVFNCGCPDLIAGTDLDGEIAALVGNDRSRNATYIDTHCVAFNDFLDLGSFLLFELGLLVGDF